MRATASAVEIGEVVEKREADEIIDRQSFTSCLVVEELGRIRIKHQGEAATAAETAALSRAQCTPSR